ncbi:peptide ligase PGM1-related protein [Intrasporangium sp. YIM S08009]|uniref:peptide ligase PGM1-related protein n=1 Tax=Intrasporangium zincisolvens TaxID=3080018 RepID=UPI002B05B022|nr:peptide ligase PGM1-related protein [Intrasporangium sp. YIM S08009]
MNEPRTDAATGGLADLDEADVERLFDALQARLPAVWRLWHQDDPRESVVVVPSMSIDRIGPSAGAMNQALEERLLFLLLLLRQPRLRMVFVTSMPVSEAIIEYYLSLLPGVIPSHARSRLELVAVGDSSATPLTDKLLRRPRLLAHIASLVPDPERSHLIPYNTTMRERDLSVLLGIPMYAADPRLYPLGTKTGCRRVFAEARVEHPYGAEDLHSTDDVVDALLDLHAVRPSAEWAMVKLNEGVSGSGNALVDLRGLPAVPTATTDAPPDPRTREAMQDRLRAMQLEDATVPVDAYLRRLEENGGIVEERVVGDEVRSPSVQLRVTPLGELEILSTHDQILGGPTGQLYLGARFPADPAYATTITRDAERVGRVLAEKGVLGRFALDFVVVRHGDEWVAHAIEINLRKGGTTHPFLTLQFLTDGEYLHEAGRFLTPSGQERHLVATDHLEDPALKGLRVDDLFDLIARSGLHFDQSRQTGVVFHMISSITECGRVGMTAIGDTPDSAQEVFDRAESALLTEARASLRPLPLPRPAPASVRLGEGLR